MTTYAQFRAGMKRPGKTPPIVRKPKPAPSKVPPVSSHPPTPTPPPTHPPTHPAAEGPVINPFQAFYQTDPRYLLQSPQLAAQRNDIYAQYGWHPNGHGGYAAASSSEDPNGIVNMLARALAGKSQQVQDSANSRGLLFSGAQAQGQANAKTDYDRNLSDAQLAFQRALSGVNQDEANLLTSLYPDFLKQAPPAGRAAPTVTKPAAGNSTSSKPKRPTVVKPFGAGRGTSPWAKFQTPHPQPPASYQPPVSTAGWNATRSQFNPKINYWGATRGH